MTNRFPFSNDYIPEAPTPSEIMNHPPMDGEMLKRLIENMKPEGERVAPDKRGCEVVFARAFATGGMSWDFPLIARDFLKHEAARIAEYKDLAYADGMPQASIMSECWQRIIIHTIYSGFKCGSEYCRDLLQYLFKTYHKKMYNQFKRFSTFEYGDILSLSRSEETDNTDTYTMAILLCMAEVFNIKPSENCDVFYLYLNDFVDKWEADSEVEFLEFPDGLFAECKKQIEEMFGTDLREILKKKFKTEKFVYNTCRYFGYPEEYILLNMETEGNLVMELAKTLAILKMTYPKKEFTKEDILRYSNTYDAVNAVCHVSDDVYQTMIDVLNLGDDAFIESYEIQFDPAKIEERPTGAKKKSSNVTTGVTASKKKEPESDAKDGRQYSQEALLSEINELRNRLHISEQEIKGLKAKLHETNRTLTEQAVLEKELEDSRKELTALRSHMYQITEFDVPADETSVDSMIEDLKLKKVTIVGGHINWVQKMKKLFPDWNFISPSVSVSNDSRWITGSDFVYFFTDTVSHSVYNTFIQVVRENDIPFGYIHGVNVNANVKQMWEEVAKG